MKQIRSVNESIKKTLQLELPIIIEDFSKLDPNISFYAMAVEIDIQQGTISLSFNTLFDYYRMKVHTDENECEAFKNKFRIDSWHYQHIASINLIDEHYMNKFYINRIETYIRYVMKHTDIILDEILPKFLTLDDNFVVYYYLKDESFEEAYKRLKKSKKWKNTGSPR